jgi:hypothetical protein
MKALVSSDAVQEAFSRLARTAQSRPVDEGGILVEEFATNDAQHFVGLTSVGNRALVLSTDNCGHAIPSIRLASLGVDFSVAYRLNRDGQTTHRRVSVIECSSTEPVIHDLFATFCAAVLSALPPKPSVAALEDEVKRWISLFWQLQRPARTEVIGLIGELTVLNEVADKDLWVRAWHLKASDNLDYAFSTPPMSVEVKSTTSQHRVHELSLNQVDPPVAQEHYFASLIVELRESGMTIRDLVGMIRDEFKETSSERLLWSALSSICGSSLPEFFDVRFSLPVSRDSLRIYTAASVPAPVLLTPMPAGVSRLRFRSDFSFVEPVDPWQVLGYVPAPSSRF